MSSRSWALWGLVGTVGACGAPTVDDRDLDGVVRPDDCNDQDAAFFPGAPDRAGDGQDQDCDGVDGVDADDDGIAGLESGGVDCDDADPRVLGKGFGDVVGDAVDQNCDGLDGDDVDGDGVASRGSGGEDCDDQDAQHHPGAVEQCDGEDGDCDPSTGEEGAVTVRRTGETFTDLSDALVAADDGDELYVCAGRYTFPAPFASPGAVTVSARADTSADVVVAPGEVGAAVWITSGSVTLRDLTLEGGDGVTLDGRTLGGTVAVEGGELTLERTQLLGGTAELGGVAWVGEGAALHLDLSDVRGGEAARGGAFAVEGGTLTARGGSIEDCAADDGAVLYARPVGSTPATVTWRVVQVGPPGEEVPPWALDGSLLDVDGTTLSWTGGGLSPLTGPVSPVLVRGTAVGDGVSLAQLDVVGLDVAAGALLLDATGDVSLSMMSVTLATGAGPLIRHRAGVLRVDDLGVSDVQTSAGPAVLHSSGDAVVRYLHVAGAGSDDAVGVLLADGEDASLAFETLRLTTSAGTEAVVRVERAASLTLDGLIATRLETDGVVFDLSADEVVLDAVDLSLCTAGDALVDLHARGGVDGAPLALSGAGVSLGTSNVTARGALVATGVLGSLDALAVSDMNGGTGAALWLHGTRLTLDAASIRDNDGTGPGVVWLVPRGDTALTMAGGEVVRNHASLGGAFAFDARAPDAPAGFDALDLDGVDVGEGPHDNAPADLYVTSPEGSRADLGPTVRWSCEATAGTCIPAPPPDEP